MMYLTILMSLWMALVSGEEFVSGSIGPGGEGPSGGAGIRQNLFEYSHDFTESYWTKTAVNQSVGIESPLGGEGQLWAGDGTASVHSITRAGFTFTDDNVLSVYAKSGLDGVRVIYLDMNQTTGTPSVHQATFIATAGGVFSVNSQVYTDDAGVESVGDGWYRLWAYVDADTRSITSESFTAYVKVTNDGAGAVYSNYIDGIQLEQVDGRYEPGSYVSKPSGAHKLSPGRNLLANSWEFGDDDYWSIGSGSIGVAYGAADPLGGYQAYTASYTTSAYGQIMSTGGSNTLPALDLYAGNVTASVYVRNINAHSTPQLRVYSNNPSPAMPYVAITYADNTAEGSLVTSVSPGAAASAGFENLTDGWARVWVTWNMTEQGFNGNSAWNVRYNGLAGNADAGERFELFGFQIEKGSLATTYEHQPDDYVLASLPFSDAAMRWNNSYDFSGIPAYYDTIGGYAVYNDGNFAHVFDDSSNDFDIALLQAVNPDIKLLVYASALTQFKSQSVASPDSYNGRLYALTQDYPVYGTDGETLFQQVSDKWNWNVTNPNAVAEAIDITCDFIEDHPAYGGSDLALMFDFFTVPQPTDWAYSSSLDYDGDGIDHNSDTDEVEAMKQGIYDYMDGIRARLPLIKLIPNGHFVLRDETMRSKVHGVYVEGSGAYWDDWSGYVDSFAMLHPDNPGGLAAIMEDFLPGGYSVLEQAEIHATHGYFEDESWSRYSVAQALLLDDVYGIAQSWLTTDHGLPQWGDLSRWRSLGDPVGPMTSNPDSVGVYKRTFEDGSIRLGPRPSYSILDPFYVQIFGPTGELIEGN
jgi:hypothetical protein